MWDPKIICWLDGSGSINSRGKIHDRDGGTFREEVLIGEETRGSHVLGKLELDGAYNIVIKSMEKVSFDFNF